MLATFSSENLIFFGPNKFVRWQKLSEVQRLLIRKEIQFSVSEDELTNNCNFLQKNPQTFAVPISLQSLNSNNLGQILLSQVVEHWATVSLLLLKSDLKNGSANK